ncbi:MAG: PEGA domain-containing protein, partial [Vicinamibacterales bacterium]
MRRFAIGAPLIAAIWLGLPAPAAAGTPAAPAAAVATPHGGAPWLAATATAFAPDQSGARRRPPSSGSSRAGGGSSGSSGGQSSGAVRRPSGSSGGTSSGGQGATTSTRRRDGDRDSNIVVDRAVPRSRAPRRGYTYRPDPRYYDPWGYGAFGLGYFYYSPWSWGPGYGGPYYGYGGYGGYSRRYYGPYGYDIGSVKLKVKPRDAEVYVDGYYAGIVDDFDGVFQSLRLDSGAYHIEIRKDGYEPLTFDVRVQVDRTIT